MSDILQSILSGDFLHQLFAAVMGILVVIVNAILFPIGALVATYMPALDEGLTKVADFFDLAGTYVAWAISALGVPALVISMVVGYYAFIVTTTASVWAVKLVVKWKSAII